MLGIDIRRDPEAVKRRIGYMSQKFSLYPDLTVTENIRFNARIYGLAPARAAEREAAVMHTSGVGAFPDQLAGTLSGGWKQRLALACALIHEPEVLFLDEPTAGIDPVARRDLWDLLSELSARGVTLFVTTHYMDEAERCTHVGYIYMARLITVGKPEAIKSRPEVTPAGARRYEIETAQPAAALARARQMPFVRDATLFGTALHLLVSGEHPGESLLSQIAPRDATASIRPIAPSLEDAFVILSREHAREHAAPGTHAPGWLGSPGA